MCVRAQQNSTRRLIVSGAVGNEQKNSRFVDQVREMEARAAKVGVAHKLHYLWPDTHYIGEDLNQTELARAGQPPLPWPASGRSPVCKSIEHRRPNRGDGSPVNSPLRDR